MDRVFTKTKAIVGARAFVASLTALAVLLGFSFNYINIKAKTNQSISVVAHRGYSSAYPENSISAFRGAADAGVAMMELDVQRTRDGEMVVFHDDDLMRVAGVHGAIKDYTLEELEDFDIGMWFSEDFAGEKIPTLDEALEVIASSGSDLVLELKEISNDEGFEQQVFDCVRDHDMLDRVIFGSFNYGYLRNLKAMDAEVPVMLFSRTISSALIKSCPADYYGINKKSLDKRITRYAHRNGKQIFAYTVKSQKQMKKLKDIGVDGLICDDPFIDQVAKN